MGGNSTVPPTGRVEEKKKHWRMNSGEAIFKG